MKCAVKFCGGCNPRYDRGAAYAAIRGQTADIASFEVAQEGEHYDLLLIIRGCTQCPYLYEEIDADARIVLTSSEEAADAPAKIREHASRAG